MSKQVLSEREVADFLEEGYLARPCPLSWGMAAQLLDALAGEGGAEEE